MVDSKPGAKNTILGGQMMASSNKHRWTLLALLALATALGLAFLRGHTAEAHQQRSGWLPISGNWTIDGNVVSNAHYGRGDMMILQHTHGSDYRISADIRFNLLFAETHYGDAGLIVRTSDPQPGVDSYKGYYAGLRPDNQTVVLGRASWDWHLLQEAQLATPITPGGWYHLELAAHGCDLDVLARPLSNDPATQIHFHDPNCLSTGVGGLRSFYADASWRNVKTSPF